MSQFGHYADILEAFSCREHLLTVFTYEELNKRGFENFVISPFACEHILALLYLGAREETAEEIRFALSYRPNFQHAIESTFKNLLVNLDDDSPAFRMFQTIFLKNQEIRADYIGIAESFDAELETPSFSNPVEAVKTMNDSIAGRGSEVKNIISCEDLSESCNMILTSIAHFKARWKCEFDLFLLCDRPFYKSKYEEVIGYALMKSHVYKFYENKHLDAVFVEVAFANRNSRHTTMTIVLPNKMDGLRNLENSIDLILRTNHPFRREYMRLALPKFKIDNKIRFKEILNGVCVQKGFTEGEADFTGISGEKGELWLHQMIQKISLDVTKDGINTEGLPDKDDEDDGSNYSDMPLEITREVYVDHPFIFYIKVKDLIIYVGRVVDPGCEDVLEL